MNWRAQRPYTWLPQSCRQENKRSTQKVPASAYPGSFVRPIIIDLWSAVGRLAVSNRRARQEPGIVTYSGTARQIRRSRRCAEPKHADLIRTLRDPADSPHQEGKGWNPGSYLSTPSSTW